LTFFVSLQYSKIKRFCHRNRSLNLGQEYGSGSLLGQNDTVSASQHWCSCGPGGGGYMCLAAERKNQFWAGRGIWSKILTVTTRLLESWTIPWSLIVKKPQDWQATNFVKIPKYVYRDHTLAYKQCYGAGAARSRKFWLKSEPET
jgi:hypothetical protein